MNNDDEKSNGQEVIESDVRFSQSILWDLQKEAYKTFGVDAWTQKGVPSYLTSNPYTAKMYAEVVIGYLRDCLKKDANTPIDLVHPFYIFDLGAGSGRFAYLFLKELLNLLDVLAFPSVKICYVMTDIVESNIDSWKSHPYFQTFIAQGVLDFAFYHHSQQEPPIELLVSKKSLSNNSIINPLVVIGNYFFDTIPQDLFKVIDGQLHEGRVTVLADKRIGNIPLNPELIQSLTCTYTYVPLNNALHYNDETLNKILKDYLQTFENCPFLFPVGAFQSLSFFSDLSKGRLLLLAGDQGVCTEKQIKEWGEPHISRHGSFSIAVSYHAIAKYFHHLGGLGLLTTQPDPLFVTLAAVLGGDSFPETKGAFQYSIDAFEPSDYWKFIMHTEIEKDSPSLEYILSLIKLGNWDPINFHAFYSPIQNQIPAAAPQLLDRLNYTIDRVWEKFFPITKLEGEFVMNLGVLLFEMKRYEAAWKYFERALDFMGENELLGRNRIACRRAMIES